MVGACVPTRSARAPRVTMATPPTRGAVVSDGPLVTPN